MKSSYSYGSGQDFSDHVENSTWYEFLTCLKHKSL